MGLNPIITAILYKISVLSILIVWDMTVGLESSIMARSTQIVFFCGLLLL